jgi:hypothetical protein
MTEFAIAAIPLLLLLVALLLGRYPGCEAAMRLAERIASKPQRRATHAGRNHRLPVPLTAAS